MDIPDFPPVLAIGWAWSGVWGGSPWNIGPGARVRIAGTDESIEISFSTNMAILLYIGTPPTSKTKIVLKGVKWDLAVVEEIVRRLSAATSLELHYVGANSPTEALYQFRGATALA